jgi:RNA polymerase sigma-70 factor (ECF subfamily)
MRVIVHALGPDRELADLIQEVFLAAMDSIGELRDPRALKSWIGTIAIHTARRRLRQRKQQRCFDLYPADDPPERADHSVPDPEIGEAARATFRVLDALPEEDRLVFVLRHVHGWKMSDIAELCGSSVSTVKRRLARATGRFTVHARREASLEDLMEARDWTSR